MRNICTKIFLLFFCYLFSKGIANASVNITLGSASNLCVESTYTPITNISIAETLIADMAIGTNVTFNLNLSSDFQFNTLATPVVSYTAGRDITAISGAFTSQSNYVITLSISGTSNLDNIVISGLEVRATNYGITGEIIRLGGNATIDGFEDFVVAANVSSDNTPTISVNPSDKEICENNSTSFTVSASGTSLAYQWQEDSGGGWTNLTNISPFANVNSATLNINNAPSSLNGNLYRCVVTEIGECNINSTSAVLTVNPLPANGQSVTAADDYLCYNTSTSIVLGSSEIGVAYQLKSGATNIGSPVSGTGASINLPTGNLTSTTTFSVEATNSTTGCQSTLTNTATVNVNNALSVNANIDDNLLCSGSSTGLTATPGGGSGTYTYSWIPTTGLDNATIANPTFTSSSSGPITFTVEVTDANVNYNTCTVTDQVSVTVNENPIVFAGNDVTICENTSIQIGNLASGGTGPYSYSWIPSSSLDNAATAQPFASPLTDTNYTINVLDANGCQTSDVINVIVTSAPTVDAGSNEVICQQEIFNFSSQSTGASVSEASSFIWTTTGLGFLSNANNLTPSYTPSPGESGDIVFTLTANGNGSCSLVQDQMTLTINPIPDFTITNNSPIICDDEAIDLDVNTSNPSATIILSAVNNSSGNITGHNSVGSTFTSGANINSILSNNTDNQLDILYTFEASALGCVNPTQQIVPVTVNPTPKFSVTNNLSEICSGSNTDIVLSTPTEGGEVVLIDVNYGSVIGTLVDGQRFVDGTTINDVITNNLTSPVEVTYTFNVEANGCASNQSNQIVKVLVYPDPKFSFNNTAAICSGETTDILLESTFLPDKDLVFEIVGITTNGSIAGNSTVGSTFDKNDVIDDLLTNSSNVSDTIKYEIQIRYNNLCLGETDVIEVAVNPNPEISAAVSDPIICNNENINISLSDPAGVAGTSFFWTANPEAGISGASSGSGSVISQTLTNTVTPYSIKEINYAISSQSPAGCTSEITNVAIEVNPELIANAGINQSLCNGGTITLGGAPTARGGSGTYLYTWSGPDASDFVTSASIANPDVEPSSLGNNVYSVQVEDANNCLSNIDNATINLSQEVNATITTTDDFICSGDSASVLGEISGGATTGTWSSSGTGSFLYSASTLDNVYIPSLADQTNGSVVLTLTSADPAGPCTASIAQVTIRISPSVIADAGDNVYVCEGGFAQIGGDVPASGGSGFYTITWTGPDGYTSSASNPIVSPTSLGANIYSLSIVDTKGCKSDDDQVTVFVNEKAIVDAGVDFAVCETNNINLSGTVSGGSSTGVWQVVLGNGTISGNTSSAGNITAVYNTTPADYGNVVILDLVADDPDGTGATGPCEVVSDRLVITINSLPSPVILNLPAEIAINEDPITLFGDPSGGTFSGPGIVAGTNNFNPGLAGDGIKTITYTYTSITTGCTNQVSQSIMVNPLPNVQIVGLDPEYCYDDETVVITGDPEGGVFTGPGVTFGSGTFLFQPSTAGVGLHTIFYQYTDPNNVTVVVSQDVRVNSSPRPQFSIDETQACVTDAIQFNDETTIPGESVFSDAIATWNWNINNGESTYNGQNPIHTFSDYGSKAVTLEVTTLNGCTFSTFREILVGAVPNADFNFSNIAEGDFTEFINATTLPGDAPAEDIIDNNNGYQWDFDFSGVTSTAEDTIIVFPGIGSYNVELKATTLSGCVDSVNYLVEIIPLINANFPYFENFEAGRAGWTMGGTNSSWELATPGGSVINSAFSGSSAWVTNADGAYNSLEQSFINSPAFDLTQLERPMLSLKLWVHTQPQFDGVVIQYSVNGGKDWMKLGDIGEGIEWYDFRGIISNPGGQDFATEGYEGWTDPTNGWVEASYSLQALAGFPQVRFRIAFGSDERNPIDSDFNGFAFDDFEIKNRTRLVLMEHFTNTSANSEGDILISSIEDYLNPDEIGVPFSEEIPREVISLRYHLNYPSFDPFYDDNTADMSARREYYDFEVPLKTVIDGSNRYNPGGNTLDIDTSVVVKNSLLDPKFRITASINPTEVNELSVSTIIEALETITDRRIIVHLAVIEREVDLEGFNFRNVLKKLIPNAGGTEFLNDWSAGTTQSFTATWNLDQNFVPVYDPDKLGLIIFVQDRISKEVYQAKYIKLPPKEGNPTSISDDILFSLVNEMTLYPNPVTHGVFNLIFPQPLQKDLHYKIVDLRGVQLYDGSLMQGVDRFQFELRDLPKGINLFMIGNEEGEYQIRKFMVQ